MSARTLYLVVLLNVAAGFTFNAIDSSRYGPCVTVFFAIALGSTAYTGWTAHRQGVGLQAPRATSRARLAAASVVFGVLFYVLDRFTGGGHHHDSWPAAVLTIAGYAVGFGIGIRLLAAAAGAALARSTRRRRSRQARPDALAVLPGGRRREPDRRRDAHSPAQKTCDDDTNPSPPPALILAKVACGQAYRAFAPGGYV